MNWPLALHTFEQPVITLPTIEVSSLGIVIVWPAKIWLTHFLKNRKTPYILRAAPMYYKGTVYRITGILISEFLETLV